MMDLLIIAVVLIIVGLAVGYIRKAKKSGVKCIGCPNGATCGKNCGGASGCSGSCQCGDGTDGCGHHAG